MLGAGNKSRTPLIGWMFDRGCVLGLSPAHRPVICPERYPLTSDRVTEPLEKPVPLRNQRKDTEQVWLRHAKDEWNKIVIAIPLGKCMQTVLGGKWACNWSLPRRVYWLRPLARAGIELGSCSPEPHGPRHPIPRDRRLASCSVCLLFTTPGRPLYPLTTTNRLLYYIISFIVFHSFKRIPSFKEK